MRTTRAKTPGVDGQRGQAMVETAITMPMFLFTFLGILQLSMAYHARLLSQYAVFKATRSASVYRVDCEKMKNAALTALLPSMPHSLNAGNSVTGRGGKDVTYASVPSMKELWISTKIYSSMNKTLKMTPMVWLDYTLENTNRDFDYQVDPTKDDKVPRVRVRMAYFFEYRIPFANWIMVKWWLMTQLSMFTWGAKNPLMPMNKERPPDANLTLNEEMVDQARINYYLGVYTVPIVANWSMRLMSDPLSTAKSATGQWKCK